MMHGAYSVKLKKFNFTLPLIRNFLKNKNYKILKFAFYSYSLSLSPTSVKHLSQKAVLKHPQPTLKLYV